MRTSYAVACASVILIRALNGDTSSMLPWAWSAINIMVSRLTTLGEYVFDQHQAQAEWHLTSALMIVWQLDGSCETMCESRIDVRSFRVHGRCSMDAIERLVERPNTKGRQAIKIPKVLSDPAPVPDGPPLIS